ncbi:inositol 1,4,5-triphosphate receptor associated 2-like [Acropora palmata]|uniref:inositol 1,4,5-triphosphate receptor associated 2-like n=1 Tax=Acropora palmata TaxID=6131 RepID=UPI003DA13A6E
MESSGTDIDDPSSVSEEAILDSLFYACDTEHLGRVSVSKLIDYLRNAISNGTEEFAGNLDDLSLIWDPDGRNMEIDLATFQEGIKEWIYEIRKQSFSNIEEDHCPSPVTVNCMESPESRSYNIPKSIIGNHVTSTPNVSSESVEGLGGESPDRDWPSELISTIESLQLNNKRLMEQHNAIQAQMESTEETNNQLTAEVEALRKQLRSYQLMIDKSKEREKENAELRQTVADTLEEKQSLQTKITQLEKECTLYESNLNRIGDKLLEAQGEVELLEDERRRLVNDLAEQKQYCSDLQEIQGVKNDMIAKENSTNSSMIVGLASENETLKMEKSRLENRILDLEDNVLRLQRIDKLSPERSLNGPDLNSTPLSRQSSLQQELEAQESHETKDLPSPMVGSQFDLNDSLDVDAQNMALSGMNNSWMSSVSLDSTSTSSTFEKYSLTALQMASEFKEKKEKALRQIDELAALDRSVEVKDRKEVLIRQLAQDLDNFAEKVSSLSIKRKVAEKRAVKLLTASQKLKEENKLLFEERSRAYQKLGTMSLCNDEMSARLFELEKRLEQERKAGAQQREELAFLEQQLSKVTEDLFKIRDEKESLSRSLENEKRLSSSLEDELVSIRKSQDELESQQTILLVRIKELESELLKTSSQLNVEKRRTSSLEESIQLSVSRHSDELKDIFDTIPTTETMPHNRSRQSPGASSPCITRHMVKTKLCDYVTLLDSSKRIQGVGRDSPDGRPGDEEKLQSRYQEVSGHTPPREKEHAQTHLERWLNSECEEPGTLSISSDSLSPRNGRQELEGVSESPSGKFMQLLENREQELTTSASQTDVKELLSTGSQTLRLDKFEMLNLKNLISTGSQTELLREIGDIYERDLVSTGSQTELLRKNENVIVVEEAESTVENLNGDQRQRRRKSGLSGSLLTADTATETKSDANESASKSKSETIDSTKLCPVLEKEKKATSLWRKKLSVAFKTPEEFEPYSSATGEALEDSVGSNFVDRVSLRVRPAPNEKEIEKQFRTLVLAFHTDQDTLNRRLEVQSRSRDVAESNMSKELQNMSNLLKDFEQLCITRDMQDMLSSLKSQVEVIQTSFKRLSTQSQQHGCVQQEARMASGVEVMICHAENLSRHLERAREDLNELRVKERLEADETSTPSPLANGSTSYDSQSGLTSQSLQSDKHHRTDPAKRNSLLNFVTAFHTTSMRAKEALRSFRSRSGMGRQRAASAVPRLESSVPLSADENTSTWQPRINSEICFTETRGEQAERDEEGTDNFEEEISEDTAQGKVSDGTDETTENDSVFDSEQVESHESHSSQRSNRPGVCRRTIIAALRLAISLIAFLVVVFIGLAMMDRNSTFEEAKHILLSKVSKLLEPVGQVIYNLKPPE